MKKRNGRKRVTGLVDVFAYTLLLISAMVGFIELNRVGIVLFWILIGFETSLMFLSWVLILVSPTYLRAAVGLHVVGKAGSLRVANNMIFLIFKVPIVILLTYLNNFYAALFVIASMFFEEHRAILMEKSIQKINLKANSVKK